MTQEQIKKNISFEDYEMLQQLLKAPSVSVAKQRFLRGDKEAVNAMLKIQEDKTIFPYLHEGFNDFEEILKTKADIIYVDEQIQNISLVPGPKGDPGVQGIQGPKGDTGATGPQGIQGTPGADGKTWYSGTAAPTANLGSIGDFHIHTTTWEIREKTAATVWTLRGTIKGATGVQGIQGPKGDTGAVGAQGIQGLKGDTGATGPQGIQGTPGADGKTWYSDTAAPAANLGSIGDFHIHTTTWEIREKTTAAVWTLRGTIKGAAGTQGIQGLKGDTGATGAQGIQGPKGDTGATGAQGIQGPKGDTGATGAQGLKGDTGATGPQGLQGPKGDTGATGPQGLQGPKGDTGATGPQGIQGTPGADGKTWYSGTAAPTANLGSIGDFHIHTTTWEIREKTAATVWTLRGTIKGATGTQGLQGPKGDTGADGKTWYTGTAVPAVSLGSVGDFHIHTTTWEIREKTTAAVWTLRGTIKGVTGAQGIQGPKGDTGATGAQGLKGDTGATGPQGLQGPKGDTGATGPQGIQGTPGTDGKTWYSGTAAPAANLGSIGDFHIHTTTWEIREKTTAAVWTLRGTIKGAAGTQGIQGPKGDTGAQGTPGTDGKTWYSGTAVPAANLGTIGDFHIHTTTWEIREKTAATVWTLRGTIKGATGAQGIQGPKGDTGATGAPGAQGLKGDTGAVGAQGIQGLKGDTGATGPQGIQGTPGTDGKTWYSGTAAPAASLGSIGDFHIHTTTWEIREKTAATVWTLRGTIKGATGTQGLQGPKGDTGATGPQGPQGIQGLKGLKGDTGATGPQGIQGPKGDPDSGYILPAASAFVLGGIKKGNGIQVATDGTLSMALTSSGTGNVVTGIGQTSNGFQYTLGTINVGVTAVSLNVNATEGLINNGNATITGSGTFSLGFASGYSLVKPDDRALLTRLKRSTVAANYTANSTSINLTAQNATTGIYRIFQNVEGCQTLTIATTPQDGDKIIIHGKQASIRIRHGAIISYYPIYSWNQAASNTLFHPAYVCSLSESWVITLVYYANLNAFILEALAS